MQITITLDSKLELGLVALGSVAISALMILLCACFKRKKGSVVSEDRKNGHLFCSSRQSSGVDPEFDDEGLRGARATSHRRLPDLPDPLLNGLEHDAVTRLSSVRSSQDNSSELYAQVEIGASSFPVNTNPGDTVESLRNNGASAYVPVEDEASATHPYDKVKSNHGYSKIKKKTENPYAKVKRTDTMESETAEADENETDTDNYDVVDALHTVDETKKSSDASPKMVLASNSSENATSFLPPPLPLPLRGSHSSLASGSESGSHAPRPPPRGRRVSSIALSHSGSSSNLHRPGSLVVNEAEGDDTPDGAAEEEGRDQAEGLHEPGAPQIHFSGDSQTSQDSKGYSSISVREPLANLKARNAGIAVSVGRQRIGSASRHIHQPSNHRNNPDSLDPHYATVDVSDAEDSDEMYAAIAEPVQPIYGSNTGSDTYAKINDRSEVPSSSQPVPIVAGSPNETARRTLTTSISVAAYSPPPQEPERVSSSPVPPTPPSVVSLKQLSTSSGSSRLHASTLSIASTTSNVGSPKPEKRQANSPLPPPPNLNISQDPQSQQQQQVEDVSRSRRSMNVDEMYAKVMKKKILTPWQVADHHAGKHRGSVDLGFLTGRDDTETVAFSPESSRRNSVDATPPRAGLDLNESLPLDMSIQESTVAFVDEEDEDIDDDDLRYEVLPAATRPERTVSESDPGYEKIQLKSEDSFSDPRYERIQLKKATRSELVEPNYEVVGFRCGDIEESHEPGYEEVERPLQVFDRRDPNYESLNYNSVHSRNEPPYATVDRGDPGDEGGDDGSSHLPLPTAATGDVTETVNNNTVVDGAIYAQVVKPKKTTTPVATALSTAPVVVPVGDGNEEDTTAQPPPSLAAVMIDSDGHQDFSVSSSRNTTIIRINTDSRTAFRYFSDDDAFGVPEQV